MKISNKSYWLLVLLVSTLSIVFARSAAAITLNITAKFNPDPSNPMRNEFVNTTVQSGYCFESPAMCVSPPMISFRLPIEFRSRAPIEAYHPGERQGAMFNLPAHWQTLTVTDRTTNRTEQVEVRISGMGVTHQFAEDVRKLVGIDLSEDVYRAHNMLWEGQSWAFPPAPCMPTAHSGGGWNRFGSFWHVPENAGTCAKKAKFTIPEMKYEYLDIGYALRTPKPLGMSSGVYEGSLIIPIGPGGVDPGDVMYSVDDSVIELRFTLTVEHTLKVEVPPGGDKVELVPQGGWQPWLQQGRKPVRLFRDQTFNISASSRFKMLLECEISAHPYDCVILDPVSRRSVELQVSVSLPNGLTDLSGQPVKRRRLRAGPANAQQFQPGFYVDRAPGILHFEIPPHQMGFMIQPGAASTYRGNVTVIWDSEV